MANRARWRMIVAVEPQAAAMVQEEVMAINPIITEMKYWLRFTATNWSA